MEFGILGPLAVWRDGEPVEIGGPRVRMPLALLLLDAGRTVSSARLIDELWADSPPPGAANALQSLVSRLRAVVDPVAVERAPGGYRRGSTGRVGPLLYTRRVSPGRVAAC